MVIIVGILLLFVMLCGMSVLAAFPVKWLFNYAAVDMFGFHPIDFWHALALCLLCGMLFKSNVSTKGK